MIDGQKGYWKRVPMFQQGGTWAYIDAGKLVFVDGNTGREWKSPVPYRVNRLATHEGWELIIEYFVPQVTKGNGDTIDLDYSEVKIEK